MSNLAFFTSEFEGSQIRVTADRQFSVFDVLAFFVEPTTRNGVKAKAINPRQAWATLQNSHPEVVQLTDNFKFPGRGQRLTPVATEESIYQILMVIPGNRGAEFRRWASQVVRERREEEANPELAYTRGRQRAVNSWKRQGKSDAEIAQQIKAIETRCHFTDTLKAHGVIEGKHYAMITNEIYRELLGGTASELKQQRGLAKKARLRDSFSLVDSSANALVEALSAQDIEDNELNGFNQCRDSASKAARKVRKALD